MSINYRMTKYEKVRVLSIRAEQLSMGAQPCVDIGNLSCVMEIAEKELLEKCIPIIIIRKFPNGSILEIPVSSMDY